MNVQPLWKQHSPTTVESLTSPQSVDVVIVGGGIFGVTAAYLLRKRGKTVCIVEKDRFGSGETGHTTAHLSYVTDTWLSELVDRFGREKAQLVWRAGEDSLRLIEGIVRTENIACDFQRVPGFLHRAAGEESTTAQDFKNEAALIQELGFAASFEPSVPLYLTEGVRISDQAVFHPLKYLDGIIRSLLADEGCLLFEQSEATEFQTDPFEVKVNDKWVAASKMIIATHVPIKGIAGIVGATLFQTKLAPYSSYAVSAELSDSNVRDEAVFWDSADPYTYTRISQIDGKRHVILGGKDHKTGQVESTEDNYAQLVVRLQELFPQAKLQFRWSGQVVETHDGLPYIGATSEEQFIATGFAGNGMTFGTVAAMMACDYVEGRTSPWEEVFSPSRKVLGAAALEYLRENFDYPFYFLKDHLSQHNSSLSSETELALNSGAVLKENGKRVACFRDADGMLTKLSAICPHMGCVVHWNDSESTWDCPCHGSRFTNKGELLAGPAEQGLAGIDE